jgi:major membrane immunogen (membrane-anchored lipoprotein)
MKKFALLLAVIFAVAGLAGALTGCKKTTEGLEDGTYFAMEDEFASSGWKSTVILVVKDGKITSVDWNAASKNGGKDKKTSSKDGDYGMVAKGGAIAEWHVQAEKVEAFLIEKQDINAFTYGTDGTTDAISGVTIHINDFVSLAKKALDNGPTERGKYTDGAKYAEQAEFSATSGWKSTVSLTVINGYIVSANWSGIHKDGGKNKKQSSIDGDYAMVAKGGASAEWHEQAFAVEKFLVEKQDPAAIKYNDGGYTDAVSGVTIHVNDFVALVNEALK